MRRSLMLLLPCLAWLADVVPLSPSASAQEASERYRDPWRRRAPAEWNSPGELPRDWPPLPATREPRSEPASSRPEPPPTRPARIERTELTPPAEADGSGMPADLWRGLDVKGVEDQLAALSGLPRSAAMHDLWRRLWVSEAAAPTGGPSPLIFAAIRSEALLRGGHFTESIEVLEKQGGPIDEPILAYVAMRARLALDDRERACQSARRAAMAGDTLPRQARTEIALVTAWCGATAGTPEAAGLAADLAREAGVEAPYALGILDAVATGTKPRVAMPATVGVLDWRFLALVKGTGASPAQALERADPMLLAALARDDKADVRTRLFAAEAAARQHALAPAILAGIYRRQDFALVDLVSPVAARSEGLQRRALLIKALDAGRPGPRRGPALRALLDDARQTGLLLPVATLAAGIMDEMRPEADGLLLAEAAAEAYLVAGRYERALAWIDAGTGRGARDPLAHWRLLADIADADPHQRRGEALAAVERMAIAGRFQPLALHQLATVLDALDYHIPIPLWETASRTPQPTTGFLPETGLLPQLQEAAKRREAARVVLLAARVLGPNGPKGAHILALGDTIRALKRSGFEAEARRIGFEALLSGWPRAGTVAGVAR